MVTVENSLITGNDSNYGGGINYNSGSLMVINSTVSENYALYGAGIDIFGNYRSLTIKDSTFSSNDAWLSGGGINDGYLSSVTITGSTFTGNTAEYGGAMRATSGMWTLENSTLSGNSTLRATAYDAGGAIYVLGGTVVIRNVTIVGNSADQGGGIYREGGVATLDNTILVSNTAAQGGPNCYGSLSSSGYNLVGTLSGCSFTTATGDITGVGNPYLGLLSDNGGPTYTHALLENSPAIDAGSTTLTTDQRGVARPQGATSDIGAFEFEPESNDTDGDGISDSVDGYMDGGSFINQSNETSDNFTDQNIDGTSFGYIQDRSTLTITVDDAPSPDDGLIIAASGDPAKKARIRVCDLSPPDGRIQLTDGDVIVVTCGSMKMQVVEGEVEVELFVDNDTITVTVPENAIILVTENDDEPIKIENLSEDGTTVTVEANGQPTVLNPGDSLQTESPVADPNGSYLVAVGDVINFDGTDSYDPEGDPLSYTWTVLMGSLDDSTLPVPTYTAPSEVGIYEVGLTVTDSYGLTNTASTLVVVYDPTGGFVTGGGWIDSPAGAYYPDPNLAGTANFGFVSKYQKKNPDTPTGQTQFQFQAGDLNFHSDSYEWLVVAGSMAQYKGEGTINNEGCENDYGLYKFILRVRDADINESDGFDQDLFRIKIWCEDNSANEYPVYDCGLASPDDDAAAMIPVGEGSDIVIHKDKKK